MNPRLERPLVRAIIPALCAVYLVWWDNSRINTGYYRDSLRELGALIAGGILVLLSLAAIVLLFWNRRYLVALIPVVLVAIYLSRCMHGATVFTWRGCDMSICDDLALYEDGTFYLYSASSAGNEQIAGRFSLVHDTGVMLRKGSFYPQMFRSKDAADMVKMPCINVRKMGFSIGDLGYICRKVVTEPDLPQP